MVRRPVAAHAAGDGDLLAAIFADSSPACWLAPRQAWWPRPRVVAPRDVTARWDLRRCAYCGRVVAQLHAVQRLARGDEVCVDWNPSPSAEDALWPYEATFDGGRREVNGQEEAGAGATLWKHPVDGGPPLRLATARVALPVGTSAQQAEASGCRAALYLLEALGMGPLRARMVGDNLGVVRYGAGFARLKRISMQALLEVPLTGLALSGWTLAWQAVRRRVNAAADALATSALLWAAQLHSRGLPTPQLDVRWDVLPGRVGMLPVPTSLAI